MDLFRLYVTDTWRASSRLTLNYGLGWSVRAECAHPRLDETSALDAHPRCRRSESSGGADGTSLRLLASPGPRPAMGGPSFAAAWDDTSIQPAVPTRRSRSTSGICSRRWAPAVDADRRELLHDSRPLEFLRPTPLTGADVVAILPSIRADLLQTLNPGNQDFRFATSIAPRKVRISRPGLRDAVCCPRESRIPARARATLVLSADVVWKGLDHTFINGIDYNRWNGRSGPVIRRCSTIAERNEPQAMCSNGPIYSTPPAAAPATPVCSCASRNGFSRHPIPRLLRARQLCRHQRHRHRHAAAPAGRWFGFNNDNWLENYGPLPTDHRHVLNLSGFVYLRGTAAGYSALRHPARRRRSPGRARNGLQRRRDSQ